MAKWTKGTSGNVRGRPKGSANHATRDIQVFARAALSDAQYTAALKRRLLRGDAPHMETLLHHYAFGKPRDVIELGTPPRPLVIELVSDDALRQLRDDSGTP